MTPRSKRSNDSVYYYEGDAYNDTQLTDHITDNGLSVVRCAKLINDRLVPHVFSIDHTAHVERWDDIHNINNWERTECNAGQLRPTWRWVDAGRPPTMVEYNKLGNIVTSRFGDANVFKTGGFGTLAIDEDGIATETMVRPTGFLERNEIGVDNALLEQILQPRVIEAMEKVYSFAIEGRIPKMEGIKLRKTLNDAFSSVPTMVGTIAPGGANVAQQNLRTPLMEAWWIAKDMTDWLDVKIRGQCP